MSTRHTISRPAHAGFMLLEALLILFGLSLILTLGAVLLIGAFRLKDASTDALEMLGQRTALIDQFRYDVVQASEVLETYAEWKTAEGCLILKKPNGCHVVYRLEDQRLKRWEQSAPEQPPAWTNLEPAGLTAEFERTGPERRLLVLKLTPTTGHHSSRRTLAITAALGGDLR